MSIHENRAESKYNFDEEMSWVNQTIDSKLKEKKEVWTNFITKCDPDQTKQIFDRIHKNEDELKKVITEIEEGKLKGNLDKAPNSPTNPNSPNAAAVPETLSDYEKALIIESIGSRTDGLGFYIQKDNPNQTFTDMISKLSNEKLLELNSFYLKQDIDISY